MRIVELNDQTKDNLLESLLKRSPSSYGEYEQTVNDIITQIRQRGDEALFEYTLKFDKCTINEDNIKVTPEEIKEAYEQVDPALVEVMKKSAANITDFHEKQMHNSW
ncbi:MAG: histidinol dehydrogenase, partial [Lachnospiraceae bacterium]|nr:histidinol dehydrogenase [Lachnospiraceae bacterium]